MANNLTLKIMANLAAKEGFEAIGKSVDNKNAAAPVQHLCEREKSLLHDLIGDEQKHVTKRQVIRQTNVAAKAITLDELADRIQGGRKGN